MAIDRVLPGLALSTLVAGSLMAVLWLVQRRTRNAAIVDVGWSASLPLLALLHAATSPGSSTRSWLLASMACVWGGRLALHLYRQRLAGHPEEGRYARLREEWGPAANRKFFWFFQFQAVAAAVLALPFLLVSLDSRPGLGLLEWLGTLLWLVGVAGEATADAQLEAFKSDPDRQGRVCQRGLWRYSRHPNYFFEILVWVGYATFASASPGFPWPWLSPAIMASTILFFTGIPPTEAQALRTRGDEYRRYQRTTSRLVPWFRKWEA